MEGERRRGRGEEGGGGGRQVTFFVRFSLVKLEETCMSFRLFTERGTVDLNNVALLVQAAQHVPSRRGENRLEMT
eukprot:746271-Hanusia_phi.AAC.2